MPRTVGVKRTPSASNTQQPGAAPGGTMGGRPTGVGRRPGSRPVMLGDEVYLWILVIIEVVLMGILRRQFRRHHGG